ncbi:17-beta-hydroxysteroid dehydrogenase type 2 [Lycodopsis pacificus]
MTYMDGYTEMVNQWQVEASGVHLRKPCYDFYFLYMMFPAAKVPMPRLSAYGASKAALSIFSRVMRLELSEWGVNVALIKPAGFRTSRRVGIICSLCSYLFVCSFVYHVLMSGVKRRSYTFIEPSVETRVLSSDIFGTSDDVACYRAQILSAASCDAREDYGDAYISSLPRGLSRMSRESSEDVSPVMDTMCHALLSVRPKPVYEPGRMGRLLPLRSDRRVRCRHRQTL